MKVQPLHGRTGRPVANQYVMTEKGRGANGNYIEKRVFQSYDSIIAEVIEWPDHTQITLDPVYWNYSRTTSKYLNQFLRRNAKELVKSGEATIANLN